MHNKAMDKDPSRRTRIVSGLTAGLSLFVPKLAAARQVLPQDTKLKATPTRKPKLPEELVREFVIAGHVDLDKLKKMLGDEPKLLNATMDWSNGDFEMAIGGAGHMGRRDIAEYLISQGGRYDLFVAAMMDEIDVVKPILSAHPELANSKGPHGIPLLAHAEHGKAEKVLEFLKTLPTG